MAVDSTTRPIPQRIGVAHNIVHRWRWSAIDFGRHTVHVRRMCSLNCTDSMMITVAVELVRRTIIHRARCLLGQLSVLGRAFVTKCLLLWWCAVRPAEFS